MAQGQDKPDGDASPSVERGSISDAERLAEAGVLLEGVIHRINNPLASLLLGLSQLAEQLARAGDQDSLGALRTALEARSDGERVAAAVRELRSLFPSDAPRRVDALRVLNDVLDLLEQQRWGQVRIERQIRPRSARFRARGALRAGAAQRRPAGHRHALGLGEPRSHRAASRGRGDRVRAAGTPVVERTDASGGDPVAPARVPISAAVDFARHGPAARGSARASRQGTRSAAAGRSACLRQRGSRSTSQGATACPRAARCASC